ncbi:MAG: DedA family protein [Nanoarchaeota archaeon]|nr:DedA family protein [Nanoarchaeota archaeon]
MISLIESILLLISNLGYLGIFIGMTIESSFFPFPSEIILIPAGALIARGEMSFFPVFFAGLFGSIFGALINYYLALTLGRRTMDFLINKYGKFLFLNKEKLKRTDLYFKKHGEITTFIGRLIPLVRQEISLPAGFARMHISKFILFTALGAGIWTAILIFVGYFFGSTAQPILKIVTGMLLVLSLVFLLIYYLKQKNNHKNR